MRDLVVRINSFLEAEGFAVSCGELAAKGVELALERRRSLERAGAEAKSWKEGILLSTTSGLQFSSQVLAGKLNVDSIPINSGMSVMRWRQ